MSKLFVCCPECSVVSKRIVDYNFKKPDGSLELVKSCKVGIVCDDTPIEITVHKSIYDQIVVGDAVSFGGYIDYPITEKSRLKFTEIL